MNAALYCLVCVGLTTWVPTISLAEVAVASDAPIDRATATQDNEQGVCWYNVAEIGVEGRAWDDTETYYNRLPARAEPLVRPAVWNLSQHSAGICVRFVTDASAIDVRWTLTSSTLAMPHMPATGVSGVDLYVRTESGWRWLAVGQPRNQSNSASLVSDLPASRREFLMYLPLYNGVTTVELGLPESANLWKKTLDAELKPIVFWGTSITQGGCASRPGMVHTAILGRRLERPIINLGFSGNGKMELEVAQLIAEIDAAVFVIDCLPNLDAERVAKRVEPLVQALRSARPTTPILFVEDRTYANAFLVDARRQRNGSNRVALRAAYERMRKRDVAGLYYLEGDRMLGEDGEDTVDGSHPTDLGFFRQANALEAVLRPILEDASGSE